MSLVYCASLMNNFIKHNGNIVQLIKMAVQETYCNLVYIRDMKNICASPVQHLPFVGVIVPGDGSSRNAYIPCSGNNV
jgi:hypothetical protein